MKRNKTILGAVLLLSSVAFALVHPGARYTTFELDFVKSKIASGAEPWTSHLNSAKNAGGDSRALGAALNWYYTGDLGSANTAITTLNSWVGQTPYEASPNNGGNQSTLEGAWVASVLAPAAEIMSLYPGWNDADKAAVKEMFRTVFLPAMLKMSYWNGNVDLTQIDALLSIAVFLDDQTSFDAGIERLKRRLPAYFYLASDDASVRAYANGTYNWSNGGCAPVQWIDGITQETCRDNNHHAQFAIAAALSAMETAWIQGVDLYTPNQERMIDAMELMGLQLTSKDMQGACNGAVTTDRYNTLEVGYNHYHNRKGIAMPETWKAISQELRNGNQQFNMFHETLTNGDIVYEGVVVAIKSNMENFSNRFTMSLSENGVFELNSSHLDAFAISVYSVDGQLLNQSSHKIKAGTTQRIDLGNWNSKGPFFIKVLSTKGSTSLMFIK